MKPTFSGHCEWCGNYSDDVTEHKDFEEGAAGRTYDVCGACIREENKRVKIELGGSHGALG
ncbi:hypothetical protein [Gilvimarinus agarilyticus]|uniref:hypothetical protein n=1 Tax=Gilvimarinus agarilyticus TaxID=679259 RepID=UPI00059F8447|nr:hypothetical protein [Gilvimarinus agarilyticus]